MKVDSEAVHLQVGFELGITHGNQAVATLFLAVYHSWRNENHAVTDVGHDLVDTRVKCERPMNANLTIFVFCQTVDVPDGNALQVVRSVSSHTIFFFRSFWNYDRSSLLKSVEFEIKFLTVIKFGLF